jgi:hypothetical protein
LKDHVHLVQIASTLNCQTVEVITMTLVLVVPTRDGLLVAADSRTTLMGNYWDICSKLIVPTRPSKSVGSVTGVPRLIKLGWQIPAEQLKGLSEQEQVSFYLQNAPRFMDIVRVVRSFLEQPGKPNPDGLVESCCKAALSARGCVEPWRGQEMFSVVLARYEAKPGISSVLQLAFGIDKNLDPFLVARKKFAVGSNDKQEFWVFGETAYTFQNVFEGVGRQFLSNETVNFRAGARPISEISVDEGSDFILDVMQATERTTKLVKPDSGIGGPTDIVLLGHEKHPQILRWKTDSPCARPV